MKKRIKRIMAVGAMLSVCGAILTGCGAKGDTAVDSGEIVSAEEVKSESSNKGMQDNMTGAPEGESELSGIEDVAGNNVGFAWHEFSDAKAGSNNLNMNYIDGDYNKVPNTCMISDGENLFITAMPTYGTVGIQCYSLDSATNAESDGTPVYAVPIPEDQLDPSLSDPEYGEPIAMGMYDKENLCVVMQTGENDYDFEKGTSNDIVSLVKIPAFDVTEAGEEEVYDTFTMTDCVERAKLAGEWFYFERDLESGGHGLFRRSIYSGVEEQISEHDCGYQEGIGVEKLTYVLNEETLFAIRCNNQESNMIIMDVQSGAIDTINLETSGEVVGTYDGYVYFEGEAADYKLPLYRMKEGVWEPELVLSNTSGTYQYNFYQNVMFLLSEDDVFVIPLDSMGKEYKEYEKIRTYVAQSLDYVPSHPRSGIWIWDGKIWTYSCLGEMSSNLKVLGDCEGIISQFAAQAAVHETEGAPGAIPQEDQQAPSYEFISNFILFNDFRVVLTGVEETAEIVIDSCEYHAELDLYNIEATLTGENGDKGMTAHYLIDCRNIGEDQWEIVDFLIESQSSWGV